MTKWTDEQQKAIDIEGSNVLVSAGAGSGKTAVLSERVLRKVKDGYHVKNLLLLTFTKDAAKEMRDRVTKNLYEAGYNSEDEDAQSAYITTFDSFSLSLLKKYHYALNIPKDIKITDFTILDILKREALDKAFEIEYKEARDDFSKFITSYSLKDDDLIKDAIIKISNKLDLLYDRNNFLENYIDNYYSLENIDNYFREYLDLLYDKVNSFKEECSDLASLLEEKKLAKFNLCINGLYDVNTYEEIKEFFSSCKLPPKTGYSEEAAIIKEDLSLLIKEINSLCIFSDSSSIKNDLLSTKESSLVIIRLLTNMYSYYDMKKEKDNLYSFSDISIMVINLLLNNTDIREEVSNSFSEILVDEYQDTSDIEEKLISIISHNNLYMVGDVKQSIYRFRNANPNIFRSKYSNYSKGVDGVKIDLNKNFRSREEVLNNINLMFDAFMDEEIGGSNYKSDGEAVFGNTKYNDIKADSNYDLDILAYDKDNYSNYTDTEKEIFIIANDIKNKIDNKTLVCDFDSNSLRECNYNDFVILLSNKKDFDLYKKIFEYLHIPLTVMREEHINNTSFFDIIYNLYNLVIKVHDNNLDTDFKYSYLSISRSFLYRYSDQDIFITFKENSFKENDIYKKALSLKNSLDNLSPKEFYLKLLETYNFDSCILSTNDILLKEKSSNYLFDLTMELESLGYSNIDVFNYISNVRKNNYDLTYDMEVSSLESVKIMSIHKSKGLEFPICYFADFQREFNLMDLNNRISYSNKYGIILPTYNNYVFRDTIIKSLYKNYELKEEISEKIRLLYVALTRSKEKLIIVSPKSEVLEYNDFVSFNKRMKYRSFYNILTSIYGNLEGFITNVDIPNISKDYMDSLKDIKLDDNNNMIDVKPLILSKELIDDAHFSKESISTISKEEKELLEFGTKCHFVLEQIDFNNPEFDLFDISKFMKDKICKFLDNPLISKIKSGNIYKEYEFIYTKDKEYHGIIDLMIEYNNEIYIFDYKLKNIDDSHYDDQLNGYKVYIESITNKHVYTYLYSIMDSKFREVK